MAPLRPFDGSLWLAVCQTDWIVTEASKALARCHCPIHVSNININNNNINKFFSQEVVPCRRHLVTHIEALFKTRTAAAVLSLVDLQSRSEKFCFQTCAYGPMSDSTMPAPWGPRRLLIAVYHPAFAPNQVSGGFSVLHHAREMCPLRLSGNIPTQSLIWSSQSLTFVKKSSKLSTTL